MTNPPSISSAAAMKSFHAILTPPSPLTTEIRLPATLYSTEFPPHPKSCYENIEKYHEVKSVKVMREKGVHFAPKRNFPLDPEGPRRVETFEHAPCMGLGMSRTKGIHDTPGAQTAPQNMMPVDLAVANADKCPNQDYTAPIYAHQMQLLEKFDRRMLAPLSPADVTRIAK